MKCISFGRLQLPGEVMEMGASNAVYDADDGKFILTVEKVNRGEYFPNLDLISTLLVKKTKNFPSKPNISVLGKGNIFIRVT
jgi:protein SHQ1